jgi:hypothetical protein
MADAVNLNTDAVKALASEMSGVAGRLKPAMRAVAAKGALNIKNAARASILAQTQHKYVKQYPNSITYDVTQSSGSFVSAEIGPDKGKPQGALGNILEFGSPGRPPLPHLVPAWEAEREPFERFMGDAGERAVFGGGSS